MAQTRGCCDINLVQTTGTVTVPPIDPDPCNAITQSPAGILVPQTDLVGVVDASCPPTSTERSVDIDIVPPVSGTCPEVWTIGARLSPCFGQAGATGSVDLIPVPNNTYVVVPGAQIVLPEAGTYDVQYTAAGEVNVFGPTAGSGTRLFSRLFNVTAGALVPFTEGLVVGGSLVPFEPGDAEAKGTYASVSKRVLVTVAGPTTIRLEAKRNTIDGTLLSATGIFHAFAGAVDLTMVSFAKVAD